MNDDQKRDIVERLREFANRRKIVNSNGDMQWITPGPAMSEAADEIKRLRAIVERSNAKMQDGQWKTAGDEVFHPQYDTSRWFVAVGLRTARTYLGMEEWDTRSIGDFYSTREAAEAAMKGATE